MSGQRRVGKRFVDNGRERLCNRKRLFEESPMHLSAAVSKNTGADDRRPQEGVGRNGG